MNFEEPEYATTINDNGLYDDAVVLTIPDTQQISKSGMITIEAYCPEGTFLEATNSAARQAILYLEREFKLEIVDYNHSHKVVLEAELTYLEDLLHRVLFLGATEAILASILDKLKDTANASKDLPDKTAVHDGFEDNMDFTNKCIAQLQAAETKFSKLFEAATKKFAN